MRVKVGYWRTGLAVQMDEEAYDWLKSNGRALCVQVQTDRRLLLVTCARGAAMNKFYGSRETNRKAIGFHAEAEVLPPYLEFMSGPDFELPRFELHELEVDYDYVMDGLLTEPLEADHLLPWPDSRHRCNRMSAEELRHQCLLRIRSSMTAGGRGYPEDCKVSRSIVRMMGEGYRLAHEQAAAEQARRAA